MTPTVRMYVLIMSINEGLVTMKTHNIANELRGQEEAGHTQITSGLFTHT